VVLRDGHGQQLASELLGADGTEPLSGSGGGSPIRTQDVFDPSSWRGWNGTDFSVEFVDLTSAGRASRRACVHAVQYMDVVTESIFISRQMSSSRYCGITLTTSMARGPIPIHLDRFGQLDQAHASDHAEGFSGAGAKRNWLFAYFSLIDPTAPDLNFSIVGNQLTCTMCDWTTIRPTGASCFASRLRWRSLLPDQCSPINALRSAP